MSKVKARRRITESVNVDAMFVLQVMRENQNRLITSDGTPNAPLLGSSVPLAVVGVLDSNVIMNLNTAVSEADFIRMTPRDKLIQLRDTVDLLLDQYTFEAVNS